MSIDKDKIGDVAIGLGLGIVLVTIVIAASTVVDALVISVLWGWFAVPVFGLPQLGYMQAAGLGLLVGYATRVHVPSEDGDTLGFLAYLFIKPFLLLLIGGVIYAFT